MLDKISFHIGDKVILTHPKHGKIHGIFKGVRPYANKEIYYLVDERGDWWGFEIDEEGYFISNGKRIIITRED